MPVSGLVIGRLAIGRFVIGSIVIFGVSRADLMVGEVNNNALW